MEQDMEGKQITSREAMWTEQRRVERVMAATGCSADDAREYLLAEEGDEADAIISYRTDRLHEGAMR
jgi:NACalpha-BTF3-like transcription factor